MLFYLFKVLIFFVAAKEPAGFIDIQSVNPDIFVESYYASSWNFIGKPINGYRANKCILVTKAARALSKVQQEVAQRGYSLLLNDCYRPQRAVKQFVEWVGDKSDQKMKAIFYPDENKKTLIKRHYLSAKSEHSRGATVDVTLVRIEKFKNKHHELSSLIKDCRHSQAVETLGMIDMGTTVDCLSDLSQTMSAKVSRQAQHNRLLLKQAMEKQNFINYSKEWWHFTLKDEPYKNQSFDFEVE